MTDDKPTTGAGAGAGPLGHDFHPCDCGIVRSDGHYEVCHYPGCAQPRSAHETTVADLAAAGCCSVMAQPAAGEGEAKRCWVCGSTVRTFASADRQGEEVFVEHFRPDLAFCIGSLSAPEASGFGLVTPPATPAEEGDVHTSHCCLKHGCKYGYDNPELREMLGPNDVCTVANGSKRQEFPCELCRDQEDHERECHAELRAALASRDQQIARLEGELAALPKGARYPDLYCPRCSRSYRFGEESEAKLCVPCCSEMMDPVAEPLRKEIAALHEKLADAEKSAQLQYTIAEAALQTGRTLLEAAEARADRAEQERDALVQSILGGDIVHYDGQPGDLTLEYRGTTREGYDGWRVAGPVVSRGADDARAKALQPTPNSPLDTSSSGA